MCSTIVLMFTSFFTGPSIVREDAPASVVVEGKRTSPRKKDKSPEPLRRGREAPAETSPKRSPKKAASDATTPPSGFRTTVKRGELLDEAAAMPPLRHSPRTKKIEAVENVPAVRRTPTSASRLYPKIAEESTAPAQVTSPTVSDVFYEADTTFEASARSTPRGGRYASPRAKSTSPRSRGEAKPAPIAAATPTASSWITAPIDAITSFLTPWRKSTAVSIEQVMSPSRKTGPPRTRSPTGDVQADVSHAKKMKVAGTAASRKPSPPRRSPRHEASPESAFMPSWSQAKKAGDESGETGEKKADVSAKGKAKVATSATASASLPKKKLREVTIDEMNAAIDAETSTPSTRRATRRQQKIVLPDYQLDEERTEKVNKSPPAKRKVIVASVTDLLKTDVAQEVAKDQEDNESDSSRTTRRRAKKSPVKLASPTRTEQTAEWSTYELRNRVATGSPEQAIKEVNKPPVVPGKKKYVPTPHVRKLKTVALAGEEEEQSETPGPSATPARRAVTLGKAASGSGTGVEATPTGQGKLGTPHRRMLTRSMRK